MLCDAKLKRDGTSIIDVDSRKLCNVRAFVDSGCSMQQCGWYMDMEMPTVVYRNPGASCFVLQITAVRLIDSFSSNVLHDILLCTPLIDRRQPVNPIVSGRSRMLWPRRRSDGRQKGQTSRSPESDTPKAEMKFWKGQRISFSTGVWWNVVNAITAGSGEHIQRKFSCNLVAKDGLWWHLKLYLKGTVTHPGPSSSLDATLPLLTVTRHIYQHKTV